MQTSIYVHIMTFLFSLVSSNRINKKHVYNSVVPNNETELIYDVSVWVRQLYLQQCVIVQIGEKYCGVFVEYRLNDGKPRNSVEEYFLGLCDLATLTKWRFCSPTVENERPKDCLFNQSHELPNEPIRVHRRLCDLTDLALNGRRCNCSNLLFHDQQLYHVTGFPTCFIPSLPRSICLIGNVCGVYSCKTGTINKIHTVQCNSQCLGQQPFCESTGWDTTRASKITSFWSDWINPFENEEYNNEDAPKDIIHSQAMCINKNTGLGALDCFGPGTNCCPANADRCKCHIYEEDGVLKLSRDLKIKSTSYDIPQIMFNLQENVFARRHRGLRNSDETEEDTVDGGAEEDDIDIAIIEDVHSNNDETAQIIEKSEINQPNPVVLGNQTVIEEMAKDLNASTNFARSTRLKRVNCFIYLLYYVILLLPE